MPNPREVLALRSRGSRTRIELRNMVRRVVVKSTAPAVWKLIGHLNPFDNSDEDIRAERFGAAGVYSKPAANGSAEVVVAHIGGKGNTPIVVAARDQESLQAVLDAMGVSDLGDDEAMLHNSKAIVYVKADGTIEARTPGGSAVALATLADVQAIDDELATHQHTYTPGSGSPTTTTLGANATNPVGTSKLKGE